jgi:hypothetical protein
MAELIKVSCKLADTAGFRAFPGCAITPFADLLEELPARERRMFHTELEPLVLELTDKIKAIESL